MTEEPPPNLQNESHKVPFKMDSSNRTIERLKEEIKKNSGDIKRLRQEFFSITDERNRLKKTLVEFERILVKQQNQKQEQAYQVASLRKALDSALHRMHEKTEAREKEMLEYELLRQKQAELTLQLKDTIKTNERELKALRDREKERLNEIEKLSRLADERKKEALSIKERTASIQEKHCIAQEELAKKEREIERLSKRLSEMEKDVVSFKKALESKESESSEKTNQMNAIIDELAEKKGSLETACNEIDKLMQKLVARDKLIFSNHLTIETQRRKIEQLHLTVGSNSTRLTRLLAKVFDKNSDKKRDPNITDPLAEQVELIRKSDLFDIKWYLQQYPDVAENDGDAALHYLLHGAAEGRDPGPEFDTSIYLERNPDLISNGINPLVHFIQKRGNEDCQQTSSVDSTLIGSN